MKLPPKGSLTTTGETDPLNYYYRPLIGKFYTRRVDKLLALLPDKKFNSVLEIGYGSGVCIPTLEAYADNYYGVDLDADPEMVRKNMLGLGVKIPLDLMKGDLFDLEMAPVDLIVAISVFEHIRDIDGLVKKLKSLLKPGGYLLIGMPRVDKFMSCLFGLIGYHQIKEHHVLSFREFITEARKEFELISKTSLPERLPYPLALYYGTLLRR